MNDLPPDYKLFIVLAAGITGITIVLAPPTWYLNFMLLILSGGILVITHTWHDRGFYLVCGSEPLVVTCSIMNLWAGLFTVCMLAGILCVSLGLLKSRQDIRLFGLFCASSFLISLLIQVSNHVLLPLLVLSSSTAIILAIQSVRTYQFRKHYTGA